MADIADRTVNKTQRAILRRAMREALTASSHEDGTPWAFAWVGGAKPSGAAAIDLYRRGFLVWEKRPDEDGADYSKGTLVPTAHAPM